MKLHVTGLLVILKNILFYEAVFSYLLKLQIA